MPVGYMKLFTDDFSGKNLSVYRIELKKLQSGKNAKSVGWRYGAYESGGEINKLEKMMASMERDIFRYLRSMLNALSTQDTFDTDDRLLKKAILLQYFRTFDGRLKLGLLSKGLPIINSPVDLKSIKVSEEDIRLGNRILESPNGLEKLLDRIVVSDKGSVYIGHACKGRRFITSDSPVSTFRFGTQQRLFVMPISQKYCLFWIPDGDIPFFKERIMTVDSEIVDNVNWSSINSAEYVVISGTPFLLPEIYAISSVFNSDTSFGRKALLPTQLRRLSGVIPFLRSSS
ncbi:DUF4238 domain-containing protein [uncultured Faecalibaculum sp.]|uniref:DUF4238 domain-containing protein n=1 Tax=uncultured Faecalibaculum sp. TaxID=1729681 RepID=UPI00272DDBD3|nr:DUF4238 domain-containing protein [uncultured Faecalibaculum sp.]